MKFSIKSKYVLNTSLALGMLIFAGCSSKEPKRYYSGPVKIPKAMEKVYKNTGNSDIKNSKAMHRATLRPYTVLGKRYYPKVVDVGTQLRGIASWYGPKFHAKKTSNGEVYNMYAMTAAHKTLPMNTMVKVDNLENGRSAIVRINDRGPFVAGRIIDLSNKAAHKIDMVRKGTVKVKLTVIGYNGVVSNSDAPVNEMPYNTNFKPPVPVVKQKVQVREPVEIEAVNPINIQEKTIVTPSKVNIQVGAFGRLEGAMATKKKYESMVNSNYKVIVKKVLSGDRYLHKVFITGFDSYNHAQLFKDTNGINGMIIEK